MSELQNFDQFFKKKMEEYSPPVPEHIWANIMAEKDKRRPVAFLFKFLNRRNMLLAAAMLLFIAGSIFTFMHTGKKEINQTTNNLETKNSIDDNTNTPHTTSTLNNKTIGKETATSEDKSLSTINAKNKNNTVKEKTIAGADEASKAINRISKDKEEPVSVVANNGNQYDGAKSIKRKARLKSSFNSAIADEESTTSKLPAAEKNNASEFILFKMLYHPEKSKAAYTLQSKVSSNFLLPPCPEIERNAAGNKDYIEFYVGPDFAKKTYTATPDSASITLMQKRKASTSFSSAFSAGVRYTRVFSNGVSIRGGINFSQINEKFTYVQSNIVQVTYIIDPATGDTTGSYITNGSRYKTTYNHYRTIDVPVVFGFETGNGKIHANLNAGMVFNIRSWQNGETIGLDSTSQPIIINTGKGNAAYQYKTNIGAGFITAASIYYKLNDRFHLLAEPYWRYNFSPISNELISLQEKYSTIGLKLGLRMDLQY